MFGKGHIMSFFNPLNLMANHGVPPKTSLGAREDMRGKERSTVPKPVILPIFAPERTKLEPVQFACDQ